MSSSPIWNSSIEISSFSWKGGAECALEENIPFSYLDEKINTFEGFTNEELAIIKASISSEDELNNAFEIELDHIEELDLEAIENNQGNLDKKWSKKIKKKLKFQK